MDELDLQQDIISLATMEKNVSQIVNEVADDHAHKIIIRNGEPAAVLVNVADYQALRDRLLAMELEMGYRQMVEQDKRGELIEISELAAQMGITLSEERSPKPEGYDEMIPKKHRRVS